MCEFKIIKKNDGSQIGEDILVISYSEDNDLIFRDVLGRGEKLESALILDVNTLNQTCTVIEHSLIKDFVRMVQKINDNTIIKSEIENFQNDLEALKNSI
ncbi:MAG: hypothetical protein ACTSRI_06215 [Promethearchaeota archaeon]